MPKGKKIGMLIWGTLLVLLGLGICLRCLRSHTSSDMVVIAFTIFAIVIPGAILIAFGIRNIILVTRYNNQLEEEYKGYVLTATCLNCRSPIRSNYKDFQVHGRYPEGFVYCPLCKAPISRNAFVKTPEAIANQQVPPAPPQYPSGPYYPPQ